MTADDSQLYSAQLNVNVCWNGYGRGRQLNQWAGKGATKGDGMMAQLVRLRFTCLPPRVVIHSLS